MLSNDTDSIKLIEPMLTESVTSTALIDTAGTISTVPYTSPPDGINPSISCGLGRRKVIASADGDKAKLPTSSDGVVTVTGIETASGASVALADRDGAGNAVAINTGEGVRLADDATVISATESVMTTGSGATLTPPDDSVGEGITSDA